MKIAVIAPTEIPARRANTVQVMKMAQAMVALGHTLRLAAPAANPSHTSTWDELARHYGLAHTFPVDWIKAAPRLRRYDYSVRALRWARGWGAELIYTRLPQAAALASNLGMPVVLELHDLPQGVMGPWIFRRFLHGKHARRLVVITHALAEDMARQPGIPDAAGRDRPGFVVIAPDGVDLERYQNLPDPQTARQILQPWLPQRFTAGYTGHLYAGRGTEILLGLASRLPQVTLLLVGGEPEEVARLKSQANEMGLHNLICTGFVPNAELPRYQAACDALLMPYQKQVAASSGGDIAHYLSPMKLFEYMACGRAILSSNLPVLLEVLNPGNALLLPPDDIEAWAAGLRELIANPEACLQLGVQARHDVASYTWEARAARILEGI